MRIPKDISLVTYIRKLIKNNEIDKFYRTDDWRELRQEVLDDYHYECQHCLKKGNYTKAHCVHHVNEVRDRPDLALSRWYVDSHGQRQPNLIPLCKTCHNIVHDKLYNYQRKDMFENKEHW